MNKLFSKIAALSVGLAMAIGVGVAVGSNGVKEARADSESVTFSEQGYSNQQAISSYVGSTFTLTFDKGTNSNAPKYYTSGTSIRAYGGNTITASSSNNITAITITFGSSDGSNEITTDVGSYSAGSWSGSSKSVVFTIGGTSGNRRLAGFSVTCEGETPVEKHNVIFNANGTGVTGMPENLTDKSGTVSLAEVVSPSRDGYKFKGWSLTSTGEIVESVTITNSDVNVYAIWEEFVPSDYEETELEAGNLLITTSWNSETYYLPTATSSGAAPAAVKFSDVSEIDTANLWKVTKDSDSWVFQNSDDEYLAITGNDNNRIRIGSTTGSWTVQEDGSLKGANDRFLGVFNGQDWRSYNSATHTNYKESATSLKFYKVNSVDPSLNNMTIYFGDAAAEGQSVDYKSSGSYQFVAKEDSTALTDVTWSVSDETFATINPNNGSLACVKPGSVTVYAEKDGYNKASASITIAKGSVSSLAVSGEMSKKAYTTAESWSHDGLVATATYITGWVEDVSSSATWTYSPENPADGVTSVVASASFGGKSASSSAQAVTVTVAHAGTAEDPFTVAEGIAKCVEIGNVTGGKGPWVTTGVISKVVQVLTTGYQNARVYMTEDGKESSPSIYVYDFKYLENAGFTEETAAYIVVGATITVTGNLLNYNNNTPEYARGGYLLDIQQPETGDVDVTFTPASTSFEIGASGTFTASSETSGVVFTWAVDNPSVLSVNESTGAYEALSLGIARVTVTASAGGKEGYAFVDFTVSGIADSPLSVAEANAIAATVDSGKTTSYYVYVEGYVKEFATSMSGEKPRALDIMSEDGSASIMVYTNVDPYAAFVDGLELGDYLKVKANIQNYSGTYELTTPEKVSNHASAFTFAFELLEQTDGQCATYVDGTSDYNEFKSFFEGKWGALEDAYNALASIEGEQTKVLNAIAKEDGNVLEQAMARYDFLVGKYKLDNFVTGRTPKAFVNSGLELSAVAENNTSIIIIVIAAASALAFTTLLVFKKKRQKNH